jgi:serine/threonine protein kinase
VLASGQKLSIDHVRFITHQLLLAVQALHEAGVQHNNVCPSNVLMSGDCTLTLTGFAAAEPLGIAHSLLSNNAKCVNVDDALRETMAFAAPPEVFLPSCCDVSPSATFGVGAGDVWAVGCILSELLGPVRKLGFGGSPIEHLKAIQNVLGQWWHLGTFLGCSRNGFFVVFDATGELDEDDLNFVTSPRSKQFLQVIISPTPSAHMELAERFSPDVDSLALDLVSSMLRFNPLHRVSVAAALRHPFFAGMPTPMPPSPKQPRFDWSGIRPVVPAPSETTFTPRGTLMRPPLPALSTLDAVGGDGIEDDVVCPLDSGYSALGSGNSSHFSFRDSPADELMSPHSSIGPITPMSAILSPGSLSFSTLSSPLHSRSSSAAAQPVNAHVSSYGGDIASPASVLSHQWSVADPSPMSQSSGMSHVRRASVPSVASSATAVFDADMKDTTADRSQCKDRVEVTPVARHSFPLHPPVAIASTTTFDMLRQCVEGRLIF